MIISNADGKILFELDSDESYYLARFLLHAKFGGSAIPEIFTHPMMNDILRKISSLLDSTGPDYMKLDKGIRFNDPIDATEIDPNANLMLDWLDAHRTELSDAEIADIFFPYQP
ncbi:MAG: hypothetical protein ACKOQM_09235 [Novosphingobium sp.]